MALRQRLNNVVNLLRTCLFGLLLGLIWLNVGRHLRGSMADVRNLSGFIFFLLINHSFSAVFAVRFHDPEGCCELISARRSSQRPRNAS